MVDRNFLLLLLVLGLDLENLGFDYSLCFVVDYCSAYKAIKMIICYTILFCKHF